MEQDTVNVCQVNETATVGMEQSPEGVTLWKSARAAIRAGTPEELVYAAVRDAIGFEQESQRESQRRVEDLVAAMAASRQCPRPAEQMATNASSPAAAAGPVHPKERQQSALMKAHHSVHQSLLLGATEEEINACVVDAVTRAQKQQRREALHDQVAEVLQQHGVTSSHAAVEDLAFMLLEAESRR